MPTATAALTTGRVLLGRTPKNATPAAESVTPTERVYIPCKRDKSASEALRMIWWAVSGFAVAASRSACSLSMARREQTLKRRLVSRSSRPPSILVNGPEPAGYRRRGLPLHPTTVCSIRKPRGATVPRRRDARSDAPQSRGTANFNLPQIDVQVLAVHSAFFEYVEYLCRFEP